LNTLSLLDATNFTPFDVPEISVDFVCRRWSRDVAATPNYAQQEKFPENGNIAA
jgi:hypothetical protein